jgi:hypothetical protein
MKKDTACFFEPIPCAKAENLPDILGGSQIRFQAA